MSILIKKNWRDKKPPLGSQLNRGHPLSQGLVGCWLMNEGSGRKIIDLVRRQDGLFANHTSWKPSPKNISIDFDGTDDYIDCGTFPSSLWTKGEGTMAILIRPDVVDSPKIWFWMGDPAGNGYGNTQIEFHLASPSSGSGATFYATDSANPSFTAQVIATDATVTTGKWYFLVGVWKNGQQNRLYVNGRVSVGTNSITTGVPPSYKTYFGRPGVATRYGDISIENGYLWNRALSPSEIRSLYEAPYQFIEPIKRRIFSIPSGAPPVTEEEEYDFMEYSKYW